MDLSRVARQACDSVFFNKGENCIAAGRLFIEETIHDELIGRIVDLTSKMVIGDPVDFIYQQQQHLYIVQLDRKTDHGPQNHLAHLRSLEKFVETAVRDGAKVAIGGKRVERSGLYFYPTVLIDVDDDNFAAHEESFGPIMIVSKFKARQAIKIEDFNNEFKRHRRDSKGIGYYEHYTKRVHAFRQREQIELNSDWQAVYSARIPTWLLEWLDA